MSARLALQTLLLSVLSTTVFAQSDAASASGLGENGVDDRVGFAAVPATSTADDALGFGEPNKPPTAAPPSTEHHETTDRHRFHLGAKLRERAGFWLRNAQPNQIAQLRSSLELAATDSYDFTLGGLPANLRAAAGGRAEYDLAYRIDRAQYDRTTIDAYELRLIGLETFVGLRLGDWELRTGRMLNPLGQGELQSTIDVLNPRDLRQVGLTDFENMRLPAWTTRIGFSHGAFRLEGIIVHEAYFGMLPPLLGRFNPVRKLLVDNPSAGSELANHTWRMHHVPSRLDPRATQFVGRAGYTGRGLDLEMYAGSVLDQIGVARLPAPAQFDDASVRLDIYHPRYTLLAHSGAKTVSDFVLRWELSTQLRRAQSVRDLRYAAPVIDTQRLTQLNGLIGLTYYGFSNVNLGADLIQSAVVHNPARRHSDRELLWPVEAPSLSLRYQHTLWDERILLSAIALVVGVHPFNGALLSGSVGYVPRDGLVLKLEAAHYQATSHFGNFYGLEKNDRLDLTLAWSFAVI